MDISEILSKCDHTLLKQGATWNEVKEIIDDGIKYSTASVCISPCFVKQAAAYAGGRIPICTVIGFPNGTQTTAAKVFETEDAVKNGADEIDMVINIGMVKAGNYASVLDEVKQVRNACADKVLKVIIETCLLDDEEKKAMCRVVSESGADFIKTSTGFSAGGATAADVALLRTFTDENVSVKAAGGIASLKDAEEFIKLGAARLGTSRIVKIVKNGT